MERLRVVDLTEVALRRRTGVAAGPVRFETGGARRAVIAWSGEAVRCVVAHICYEESRVTETLSLASGSFPGEGRLRSQTHSGELVTLAVDELRTESPLASLTIEADAALGSLAVATSNRPHGTAPATAFFPRHRPAISLDVRPRSQYGAARLPIEDVAFAKTAEGWCAPTSLAMLLEFHGVRLETHDVARAIFDSAYGGTGNWSFGAGFASRFGFASVAYLRDLAHARAFVDAGYPLGLSFRWSEGALPGAPLLTSSGHLAVLRGFGSNGDPEFADPAQPSLVATYDYAAFERVWLGHGGVAFLVAPERDSDRVLALANEDP